MQITKITDVSKSIQSNIRRPVTVEELLKGIWYYKSVKIDGELYSLVFFSEKINEM